MSPLVDVYFDDAEVSLIQSPVIDGYEIIRRDVALTDGKLRLRARLQDGGLLEIFMYATEVERQIHLRKYSFHWQDSSSTLVRRWDNAPHFPHLPGAPDHIHLGEQTVVGAAHRPTIETVLAEIAQALTGEQ